MKLHRLSLIIPAIAAAISASGAPKAPLMGWSSWNAFFVDISDSLIMRQTDLLGELGLADAGYRQVNIDDGFFGHRDSTGRMQAHPVRFPNGMRHVVDYIHSKGYKAGTYSDAGHNTCGSMWNNDTIGINAGMYEHEDIDAANAFGDWNFDFIKIDYCGAECDGLVEQEQYTKIRQALDRVRPGIALNICRWRFPGTWAEGIAESWRISQDIMNDWESIKSIVDLNAPLSAYCRNGHYNDMDMLTIGLRENTSLTGDGLDHTEESAQFGMWCIMSSPLLIGCDLEKIPASSLEILKNPELIAVNQDSLALQAYPAVREADGSGVFVKDIVRRNGLTRAVALYNPTDTAKQMVLRFSDIDLGGKVKVRDLSNRRDVGVFKDKFTAEIPAHGAIVYAVEGTRRFEPSVYEAEWGYLPMFDNIGRNNVKYTYDTSSSGCMKVEFLGASPENYIEWPNVYSEKGGRYSLNIKATPECPLQIWVNGSLYETDSAADKLKISLKPGFNTIRIGHDTSAIPAIDFISLVKQ